MQGKVKLAFFVIVLVLYSALTALLALVLANIMNAATGDSMRALAEATGLAAFAVMCYAALQYTYSVLKNTILTNATLRLKENIFTSIMAKSIPRFEERNSASYINELTTKVNMVSEMYFANIISVFHLVVSFTSAVIVTIYFQSALLLVMVALGFLSYFLSKVIGKGIEEATKNVSDSTESYQVGLKEFFSGFRIIKAYAVFARIKTLHDDKNHDMENKKRAYNLKTAKVECISHFAGFLSTIIIMAVAAAFSIAGMLTVGAVFAVGHLMGQVTSPIYAVPGILINFRAVNPINHELKTLLEERAHAEDTVRMSKPPKFISISDMGFSFEEIPVFKNVRIDLEMGKKYIVIGETGSGKTTLLSLLLGFYDNYSGKILFDDTEIRDIDKTDLQKMIGSVFQETFLFDDTLINNLTLYDETITESDVLRAAEKAGLSDFISDYPGGLNGRIKENGKNISGGERQRVSLTRVLLRKLPIMLLDEVTSNLDNETTEKVENNLLALHGTTLIVVTHKYNKSLLEKFDKVILVKNGSAKIIDSNGHETLI